MVGVVEVRTHSQRCVVRLDDSIAGGADTPGDAKFRSQRHCSRLGQANEIVSYPNSTLLDRNTSHRVTEMHRDRINAYHSPASTSFSRLIGGGRNMS